jgi:hypothetical protein
MGHLLLICRNLTRILGVQLLTGEAIPLLVLHKHVRTLEEAQKLSVACFVRATLSSLIGILNSTRGGWLQASWADAGISFIFSAIYGWFAVCGLRPRCREHHKTE